MPAFDDRAGVDAEDLPFLQPALARDAVNDLLVHAGADHTRERWQDGYDVALEVRCRAVALQDVGGDPVELARGHTRPNRCAAGCALSRNKASPLAQLPGA